MAGGPTSVTSVLNGGHEIVSSGGIADGTIISTGGTALVSSGGTADGTAPLRRPFDESSFAVVSRPPSALPRHGRHHAIAAANHGYFVGQPGTTMIAIR